MILCVWQFVIFVFSPPICPCVKLGHMSINVNNMIDRIRQVIDYSQLSASAFADTIGISRSGLTHLLTGRNQPSLDVARKILAKYPEVSTEWLIMGMGEMLRSDEPQPQPTAVEVPQTASGSYPDEDSKIGTQFDLFGDFGNPDDSEEDVDEENVSEKAFQEEEPSDDEPDTVVTPVAESHPEPAEAPSESVRAAVVAPRPRKTASDTRPAPVRRERHAPAQSTSPAEKKLQKIVFFYDDHSFEVYNS